MPASWDFSYDVIWPMVMNIVEPFGPWIGIILAIIAGTVLFRRFAKMGN